MACSFHLKKRILLDSTYILIILAGLSSYMYFSLDLFTKIKNLNLYNRSLNRQSGAETTLKAFSTTSYNLTTNCKSHYKNQKLSLPSGCAIVNSNKQISRSIHSTNLTLKGNQSCNGNKFNDEPDKKFVRNECFPRVDTSKCNKGILCKIAAFFGIGCAKKKSDVGCKKCQ